MLGHLFNRQHRLTHHSTVTALQGCLIYQQYRSLSLQSCPNCSPWCLLMFLSFLTTFQYMMAGIHLEVQLYEKLCILLIEVWQARSAWNISDCLILLLLLRKKVLEVFRACEGGSCCPMKNSSELWRFYPHMSWHVKTELLLRKFVLYSPVRSFQHSILNCSWRRFSNWMFTVHYKNIHI